MARIIRRSKYGNHKTLVDGIIFDSRKEANRYAYLKTLLRAGEVKNLQIQPKFDIVINGVKICYYKADFAYSNEDEETVIEDVKSTATAKNPVYRLKKKLVEALHHIQIKEV